MASDFKNLLVWQKSMDLTCAIYQVSQNLPLNEKYSLTDQMRRAAVSIPSNIAEGQGRCSQNEFYRFLTISHGSLKELETQLLICERLNYLRQEDINNCMSLISEIGKLLGGLLSKIKSQKTDN
ncbi:MAG: four helix bundle protein [Muribaculaceae bacterium]|nr:four helix bundle protein [Muribaculaceae bacterium]